MNKSFLAVAAAGLSLISAGAIFAHHSAVRFDIVPVTIEATVQRMEIVAPHSLLYMEQATPDGTILWAVEGPAPNALARRGIDTGAFTEGATVRACGYLLRDGTTSARPERHVLLAEVLVMPDGAARLWSPYGREACREQGAYEIVD